MHWECHYRALCPRGPSIPREGTPTGWASAFVAPGPALAKQGGEVEAHVLATQPVSRLPAVVRCAPAFEMPTLQPRPFAGSRFCVGTDRASRRFLAQWRIQMLVGADPQQLASVGRDVEL